MSKGKLRDYSGMTTKIRAMKKKLLSPEQYEEITRFTTVADLINYLQTLPAYSGVLANLTPATAHRGEVESRMTFSTYNDFSKIFHFAGNSQKKYLEFYFMKYEISILKSCMRNIMDSRPETEPVLIDKHFKRHSKINIDKIITASDMDDFVNNLTGTVYEKPLRKILQLESPILFDFEMTLDLFFFIYIWEHQNIFIPKGEKDYFKNSFGVQVDLLNILWIYRCKKYYTLTDSQIYSFLIPIYFNIDRTNIKNFVEAETIDNFFDLIESCYYGRTYTFRRDASIEAQFGGIMNKVYLQEFKESPYSLASINAYFQLKNLEVAKVVTAMECIRYGYKPDVISQYINQKRGVL